MEKLTTASPHPAPREGNDLSDEEIAVAAGQKYGQGGVFLCPRQTAQGHFLFQAGLKFGVVLGAFGKVDFALDEVLGDQIDLNIVSR